MASTAGLLLYSFGFKTLVASALPSTGAQLRFSVSLSQVWDCRAGSLNPTRGQERMYLPVGTIKVTV